MRVLTILPSYIYTLEARKLGESSLATWFDVDVTVGFGFLPGRTSRESMTDPLPRVHYSSHANFATRGVDTLIQLAKFWDMCRQSYNTSISKPSLKSSLGDYAQSPVNILALVDLDKELAKAHLQLISEKNRSSKNGERSGVSTACAVSKPPRGPCPGVHSFLLLISL